MTITHHPDRASLISCSAGSMPESFAAVMAGHIASCAGCRAELAAMETIGAALFDELAPAPIASPAPVIALRASEAEILEARSPVAAGDVPAPLIAALGDHLDNVPWRRVAPGVWRHQIKLSNPERGSLQLLKMAPGVAAPEHGHRGHELTLVLRGAFTDASGAYRVGDVADVDDEIDHRPLADPHEGCICLTAVEGRLKFKSRLAALAQRWFGF